MRGGVSAAVVGEDALGTDPEQQLLHCIIDRVGSGVTRPGVQYR